jgi:hypothetical protein
MTVGIPSNNPRKYLGPNVSLESIVVRDRAPTGADIRGTASTYYPIGSLWIVGENPTTGTEGDLWYLSKIVANVAYWERVFQSPGPIYTITGNSGGAAGADSNRNFNIVGTSGQINVVTDPVTNTATLSLTGGGTAIDSFTTNNGTVSPTALGAVLVNASTTTFTDGATANTLKTEVQGTNHALFVGRGTGTNTPATTIAPGSTSGVPLISQGAAADPAYGTAVVAGGGTGVATFANVNSMIITGTTAIGAVQNPANGASGTVWTSNGVGVSPTWQTNTSNTFTVARQVFTNSGTYTPTAGMDYCIIEAIGGGGGGGGYILNNDIRFGGGGAEGGYANGVFSAATVGASQVVTIGAAGTATTAAGGVGGTTSVGALISCTGGGGGGSGVAGITPAAGGTGGVGTGGDYQVPGENGESGYSVGGATNLVYGGAGGGGSFGSGAAEIVTSSIATDVTGNAATGYGCGGGGAAGAAASARNGGTATAGIVIITEYVS